MYVSVIKSKKVPGRSEFLWSTVSKNNNLYANNIIEIKILFISFIRDNGVQSKDCLEAKQMGGISSGSPNNH